ncbi:hypothetical protein [Microbacterium sp. Leaf203]|uniref:hypothetical protein n=1 Tax=Microbacterium sp. Leaf203 TaxID=1735677 RepID=UPI0006F4CEF1|nr:hypothetical protein [Microbacterium sp. Leaf203]KQM36857.1 hypothetical protein ASE56_10610 [Microbacterium sp. Leaf203]
MSVYYQDGAPAHRRFSTPGKGFWALLIVSLVLFGGPGISPAVVSAASGYVAGTVDQRTQQAHEASQALAETGDERGIEAGERFVSNASGILTEVSNLIEDVKASLAGEVR